MREVAKEFRITQACVSMLVTKVKKNPRYLEALVELDDEKAQEAQRVKAAVEDQLNMNVVISSFKDLNETLKNEYAIEVKDHKLLQLMH